MKRFINIVWRTFVGLVLTVIITYGLLHLPVVQTLVVRTITSILHSYKGVDISVGNVDFVPIRSLSLSDLLILDFKNDTLLSADNLSLKIGGIDFVERDLKISEVVFNGAEFVVWRDADSTAVSKTNVSRLIDSLRGGPKVVDTLKQSNSTNAEKIKRWFVDLQKVVIQNSRFRYINSINDPREYGVDWTDIDCFNWNAELSNLHIGDTSTFAVRNMSFTEKSGLECTHLEGDLYFMHEHVLVRDAEIALKESRVFLDKISFEWDSSKKSTWGDYCKNIYQTYVIKEPSYVNFRDIAYFNGILRGIENTAHVSGIVKNTIDKLEGDNLRIRIEQDTRFEGSFKTYGLPDVVNTVFDINVVNGYFSPKELATIYLPWFKYNIPVPEPMKNFKVIRGDYLNFDGKFSDFELHARANSNGFRGDISMVLGESLVNDIHIYDFWGTFAMSQVDMKTLTGLKDLGEASLYGEFSGARDSLNIYTSVQSEWPYISLGNDKIENLSAYVMLDNNVNHIVAQTNDNGVFADVVMTIESDGDSSQNRFDFMSATATLYVDTLSRFGYVLADSSESMGFNAKYLSAGTGESLYDRLYLSDLSYKNSRGMFEVDTLLAELKSNGERQEINFDSHPLTLYAEGKLNDIFEKQLWNKLYAQYMPALDPKAIPEKKRVSGALFNDFDVKAYVLARNVDTIVQIVNPDYYIENNSMFSVDFTNKDALTLKLVSDSLKWNVLQANDLSVNLSGNYDKVDLRVSAETIKADTVMAVYNFMNQASFENNHISNRVFWGNWGEKSYAGDVRFNLNFDRQSSKDELISDLALDDGVVVFGDSVWHISKSNIKLCDDELTINDFKMNKGDSYVYLNGNLSHDEDKNMSVDINEISLQRLAMFVPGMSKFNLFGVLSGNCVISDYYSDDNRHFEFGIQLDDWGIGIDTLGTLTVNSLWDAQEQQMILQGENRYDREIPFSIYATYKPEPDSLNMELVLQTVKIDRLNDYFGEYVTGSSGGVSGEIMCVGTLNDPQIFGTIYMDSVQMTVKSLGTSFMINDNINIQGNRANFNDFVLYDVNNQTAQLNGYYDLFDNVYDFSCQTDKFTFMNTNASYNDSFYGRLCIGGYAHMDNLNGVTNLAIDWYTAGNSVLYLPLVSDVNDDAGILTFIKPKEKLIIVDNGPSIFEGVNLDANIEVDDKLEVQVIFDPSIGDILTCSGKGNLKFTIDNNSDLGMSGEYIVEKGDYLFTLGGIWNKHFVLRDGGSIVWNGTPYDATLNLSAEYNLRTSLYELYESAGYDHTQNSDIKRKVPVQCKLTLTDRLTNPVIDLDIDFPTLDNQTKSYIHNLFTTEDEINKQVFSLLVLNKFTAPDYLSSTSIANQAGAAGITTLTELVSNKLSRLISRFSNAFDVGVTYRIGDEVTSDELELALSTQLFNDRMTISANGNVSMNNGAAAVAESRSNQVAGDFDVDVKLNKQGTLHLKAYSHTDEKILYYSTETIQGIGLSYQEQFDTFKELLRKYASFFKRKKR